jgi:hypothetical protein
MSLSQSIFRLFQNGCEKNGPTWTRLNIYWFDWIQAFSTPTNIGGMRTTLGFLLW